MLYNLSHILNDIKFHIENQLPFSMCRLGDGDIKLIANMLQGEAPKEKFKQQGIPTNKIAEILELYKEASNEANYVSSFDMYFTGELWHRPLSTGTRKRIKKWKDYYNKIGITNENYCSPEIGFFFFLHGEDNLFSILKDRRICLITSFSNIDVKINTAGFNSFSILIPPLSSNHYEEYENIKKKIKSKVDNFDVCLVGAGTLGRGYSQFIKQNGKVAIDIGQVFNAWNNRKIPQRLKSYLTVHSNGLTFKLTKANRQYRQYF